VAHKNRSILPRPSGRPGREWIIRIPKLAHARSSWADTNGLPLSALRRRRRNADYADVRVMPTINGKPLWDKGNGLSRSA